MSDQNSGRQTKSFPGNGIDPPHMQSSLSPQGYGLYNFGGGDADSMLADSTSITSGLSPLKKQTISYNDYLTTHPQHDSSNVSAAMHDSNWNGTTGNENLTALSTTTPTPILKSEPGFGDIGSGGGRSFMNTTTAPSFDSKPFGNFSNGSSRNIIDAKALEKSQLQQQQQQLYSSNNSFTGNRAAAANIGNGLKATSSELDRDSKKDRLIDSFSKSDMITCLPGFKKGSIPYKPMLPLPQIMGDGGNRMSDKVTHHLAQQDRNRNVNANSSGPISTVRGPIMPLSSSYARQTPASFSSALNYKRNDGGRSIDGAIIPIGGDVNGSFANGNSNGFAGNSVRNAFSSSSRSPPPSPISRAKAAIGRAQSEVSKINSYLEGEEDRRKPPGAWKNMGTPFFSEPLTRSAQRQQKAQYRIDLERQIEASKMRKAEAQRKEKDSNDHPLGPEYAHPALTYYNPPQKISGSLDQGGTSPTTTTSAAAITKYIKEKYAMDIPPSGGGNTMGAFTSGYPQETGGSSTALGRIAPLQQTKKEKALANLMKSRMHPGGGGGGTGNGDQNHSTTSRPLPMNQLQAEGTKPYNGMMVMQPGNDPRFLQRQQQAYQQQQHEALEHHVNPPNKTSQQQQYQHQQQQLQQHPGFPSQQQQQQYPYPPGTYPPRPYGMNAAWPAMPMYPAYPPYYGAYGQPMYPSVNQGALIPQQMQPTEVQRQQQNYPSSRPRPTLPPEPVRSLRSILHDRNVDDEDSCGDVEDDTTDFETLKEKAYKQQKIWQTSDELPDPGLRTAVYKVELRKQIDEDRKRKAERLAHEKEEDERIERKIREFHEEERRRIKMEQQTRAELEGYHRHKIEKQRKKSEAFTVSRHMDRKGKDRRPRSRSSLLAEKLASFGPDAGDFKEPESYPYYDYGRDEENEYDYDFPEKDFTISIDDGKETSRSERRSSPPVPVVRRKLIENFLEEGRNPRRQISSIGQDFLFELKSKLASERDLVERRLKEKIESTHKNMNLLKYTMNQGK